MDNKAGFWHRGGDLSRPMTFYRDEESPFWDRHATWLASEWLMVWESHPVLSRAPHPFLWSVYFIYFFCSVFLVTCRPIKCFLSPLPVSLMPLFIFAGHVVKMGHFCRNLTEGRGRLRVLQTSAPSRISPYWCSSTGSLGRTFEEGREIICDTFSKNVKR